MTRKPINVPMMLKKFFGEYLPTLRSCSPNTIGTYAEAFSIFLKYLRAEKKINPSRIAIKDFSAKNIIDFLNHIEKDRGNSISTRNARLTAIHSFVKYLLIEYPNLAGDMQGVLSVPAKKSKTKILDFLSQDEMDAIITSPDHTTWAGKRDSLMFMLMYNTGARVSEIADLRVVDIKIAKSGTVHLFGKGRKERVLPLWKSLVKMLDDWIKSNRYSAEIPLFPNNRGTKMTRSAIAKRLENAVISARQKCPSLKNRKVSPHSIRHSTAMRLLQSGMDITVIAMWLGHENIETTHIYITADMKLKEEALHSLQKPNLKHFRYQATDSLLAYLDEL